VTGEPIGVRAQWALHGKNTGGEGYRILAYSSGDLSGAHFADALSRFQLGALDTLPQVSVSYAQHGSRPGGSYLALAIHWFAREGQRFANGVPPLDNHGRPTAFTSYFCLPYRLLATSAIGYLAMYEALRAVTLPVENGPPIELTIAAPATEIPGIDNLAMRVAALLLTDRPVCVLGADDTGVDERLRFIDAVMGLLPYGYRSRMTAATWTRSTYRDHRFRLFFSSAPRPEEQLDHVVTWGEPDMVRIPDGAAGEYFDWLIDKLNPLAVLPRLSTEIGFGPKAAIRALESVDGVRPQTTPSGASGTSGASGARKARRRASPPRATASDDADSVEQALLKCAAFAEQPNLTRLRPEISFLNRSADSGEITDGDRERYRELIGRLRLLRPNHLLEKYEERLYAALLALAFGRPLGYQGYCQVEDCLKIRPGTPPHPALLHAIERGGTADLLTAGILYSHATSPDEKTRKKWLGPRNAQLDVPAMIGRLARDWERPRHARIVCDLTVDYLKDASSHYEPQQVRHALRQHGFLAAALSKRHHGEDQYQVYTLYQFLKAAYPGGLGRQTIVEILTATTSVPTPALLGAVLLQLPQPGDRRLAHEMYVHGSLTLMDVDSAMAHRLRSLAPPRDAAAIGAAAPPRRHESPTTESPV
jgi:hypothetical protein